MDGYDVFLSYAHSDRERVVTLRGALEACGLRVWLDDTRIETFRSISGGIERGLERSKALVAFYSREYPRRRACQWELTAAFLAAERLGDPQRRVLVVNPAEDARHIEPVTLRDALFASAPATGDAEAHARLAERVAAHVRGLTGELGDLRVSTRPPWFGRQAIGSARFVGRVVDMWKVHSALHAGEVALITGARGDALAQVTGMGGIGKSLLAAEYALRFAAAYPGGVFWLRAFGHDDANEPLPLEGRMAQRDTQLLEFAHELGLDTSDLPPERLAGALGHTLDERAQRFLWIVDDLPGELARFELDGWLAPGRHGRTLLTTRSRNYESVGNQIDLGVLTEDEGVELLRRHRQPDSAEEAEAARGLVADLGGHALALDVAGAALKAEQGVRSFAQYRAALANPTADELELAAGYAGELPTGHEKSIASTLARSITRLEDAGLDFLRLASVLAVQPIPKRLVIDVFAHADRLDPHTARQRAVSAMAAAATLSLAETVDEGDGSQQVHTLVSRTIRLLERDARGRLRLRIVRGLRRRMERSAVLAAAAIETFATQLRVSSSTHIAAAGTTLAHARHLSSPPSNAAQATLLQWVTTHDTYRGDWRSARVSQEQVVEARRRILGEEHPDTLTAKANLAQAFDRLGDLASARPLQEQAVETLRRVLGEEHPDTLTAMNNVAATLYALGDRRGAHDMHVRVLKARRRALGEEHPDTLMSMNNLALALRALDDRERARGLQERVVEIMGRVLGEEHPDTLTAMGNLASALAELADLEGARAMHEQVLKTLRRVLGDEHPDTLTLMNNLALTVYELGDLEDAHAMHEQALKSQRRLLGEEHPDTLMSMNNVAATLDGLGDLEGARAMHEQVLKSRRRLLGEEHPDTRASRSNLEEVLRARDTR